MKGVMLMDFCKECGTKIACPEDDYGCICEACWMDSMAMKAGEEE